MSSNKHQIPIYVQVEYYITILGTLSHYCTLPIEDEHFSLNTDVNLYWWDSPTPNNGYEIFQQPLHRNVWPIL